MPRGKRKRGVAPKAPSPEIYDTIVVKAPQAAPVKPAVSQNDLPQPVTLSKCTPRAAATGGKSASSTPAQGGRNALATPAREGRGTRGTPVRGGKNTPTTPAEPTAVSIKPRPRKQLIVEKNGSPLAKKISENEQSQLLGTGEQASGTSYVGLQQHDKTEQEQVTIIGGTNDKGEQLEGSSERSLQLLASETLAVKALLGTMRIPNTPKIPLNGDQLELLDIHMSQYQQEELDVVDTQKSGVAPVGTVPNDLVDITGSTDSTTLSSTKNIGLADTGPSVSFNSHKEHNFAHLATEVREEYQQIQEVQGISSAPQALANGFGGLVGNVSAGQIDATRQLITVPIVLDNSTGDILQDSPVQTEALVTVLETSQISGSGVFTQKTKDIHEPAKVNVQPTASNEVGAQTKDDFINSDQGAVSGLSKGATLVSISSAIEDQGLPMIDAKDIFAENPRSTLKEAPIESSDSALASPLTCLEDLDENTGALRKMEVPGGRQIISSGNIPPTNLGATSNKVHMHLSKSTVTGLNDHEIAPSIEGIVERHNSPFVASIKLLQSPSKSTNYDTCIQLQEITAPALSISSISEVEDNEVTPSLNKIPENLDIPMVEAYGPLPENSVTTKGATAIASPSIIFTMLDNNGNLSSKEGSEGLNVPMAGSGDILPKNTLLGYASDFLIPHTNTDSHEITNSSVFDSENALQSEFVSTSGETDTQSLSATSDQSELLVKVGGYKISSSNGQGFQEDFPMIDSVDTPLSNSGLTTENISLNNNISIPLIKFPSDITSETSPGTSTQVPLRYTSTADTLETFQIGDSRGSIPNSEFEQTLQTETEIKNSHGEEENPGPSDDLEEGHVSLAMDMEEEYEHNELWALDLSLNMFSESDEEVEKGDDEGKEEEEDEEEEGREEEREEDGS